MDVALVHGSDAADRQWHYIALSRHRMRCRYFDVAADRDVDGVHHGRRPDRTIKERLIEVMSQESRKASTLDYPTEYRRQLRFDKAQSGPRGGLDARPTGEQMDAMVHSPVAWRLPVAPTWIHAALLLEQHGSSRRPLPTIDVRQELENLGLGEPEAAAVIARAQREVEPAAAAHAVPHGYGRCYEARLHRELWEKYCKQAPQRPRPPVTPTQCASPGDWFDRHEERERKRRRAGEQRERERSRQHERDRGRSMW